MAQLFSWFSPILFLLGVVLAYKTEERVLVQPDIFEADGPVSHSPVKHYFHGLKIVYDVSALL